MSEDNPSTSPTATGNSSAMRSRIEAFMQHYDPPKAAQALALFDKQPKKGRQFLAAIVKKYGPDPDSTPIADDEEEDQRQETTPPLPASTSPPPQSPAAVSLEKEDEGETPKASRSQCPFDDLWKSSATARESNWRPGESSAFAKLLFEKVNFPDNSSTDAPSDSNKEGSAGDGSESFSSAPFFEELRKHMMSLPKISCSSAQLKSFLAADDEQRAKLHQKSIEVVAKYVQNAPKRLFFPASSDIITITAHQEEEEEQEKSEGKASLTQPLTSYFAKEESAVLHLWASRAEARCFINSQKEMTNALYKRGLLRSGVFNTVVSTLVEYQSSVISVTWLPRWRRPLVKEGGSSGFVAYAATHLSEQQPKETGAVPCAADVDRGLLYFVSKGELLLQQRRPPPLLSEKGTQAMIRTRRTVGSCAPQQQPQPENDQQEEEGERDVNPGQLELDLGEVVDRCVDAIQIVRERQEQQQEEKEPPQINEFFDSFVKKIMRYRGLGMQNLFQVYSSEMWKKEEGSVEQVRSEMLKSIVARCITALAESALTAKFRQPSNTQEEADANKEEGGDDQQEVLEFLNAVLKPCVTSSQTLTLAIRSVASDKFSVPSDFVFNGKMFSISQAVKAACTSLGLTFSAKEKRFTAFTPPAILRDSWPEVRSCRRSGTDQSSGGSGGVQATFFSLWGRYRHMASNSETSSTATAPALPTLKVLSSLVRASFDSKAIAVSPVDRLALLPLVDEGLDNAQFLKDFIASTTAALCKGEGEEGEGATTTGGSDFVASFLQQLVKCGLEWSLDVVAAFPKLHEKCRGVMKKTLRLAEEMNIRVPLDVLFAGVAPSSFVFRLVTQEIEGVEELRRNEIVQFLRKQIFSAAPGFVSTFQDELDDTVVATAFAEIVRENDEESKLKMLQMMLLTSSSSFSLGFTTEAVEQVDVVVARLPLRFSASKMAFASAIETVCAYCQQIEQRRQRHNEERQNLESVEEEERRIIESEEAEEATKAANEHLEVLSSEEIKRQQQQQQREEEKETERVSNNEMLFGESGEFTATLNSLMPNLVSSSALLIPSKKTKLFSEKRNQENPERNKELVFPIFCDGLMLTISGSTSAPLSQQWVLLKITTRESAQVEEHFYRAVTADAEREGASNILPVVMLDSFVASQVIAKQHYEIKTKREEDSALENGSQNQQLSTVVLQRPICCLQTLFEEIETNDNDSQQQCASICETSVGAASGAVSDNVEEELDGVSERLVKAIVFQLLAAVSLLHSEGVTHNKISPESLFLMPDGTVCLGNLEGCTKVGEEKEEAEKAIDADLRYEQDIRGCGKVASLLANCFLKKNKEKEERQEGGMDSLLRVLHMERGDDKCDSRRAAKQAFAHPWLAIETQQKEGKRVGQSLATVTSAVAEAFVSIPSLSTIVERLVGDTNDLFAEGKDKADEDAEYFNREAEGMLLNTSFSRWSWEKKTSCIASAHLHSSSSGVHQPLPAHYSPNYYYPCANSSNNNTSESSMSASNPYTAVAKRELRQNAEQREEASASRRKEPTVKRKSLVEPSKTEEEKESWKEKEEETLAKITETEAKAKEEEEEELHRQEQQQEEEATAFDSQLPLLSFLSAAFQSTCPLSYELAAAASAALGTRHKATNSNNGGTGGDVVETPSSAIPGSRRALLSYFSNSYRAQRREIEKTRESWLTKPLPSQTAEVLFVDELPDDGYNNNNNNSGSQQQQQQQQQEPSLSASASLVENPPMPSIAPAPAVHAGPTTFMMTKKGRRSVQRFKVPKILSEGGMPPLLSSTHKKREGIQPIPRKATTTEAATRGEGRILPPLLTHPDIPLPLPQKAIEAAAKLVAVLQLSNPQQRDRSLEGVDTAPHLGPSLHLPFRRSFDPDQSSGHLLRNASSGQFFQPVRHTSLPTLNSLLKLKQNPVAHSQMPRPARLSPVVHSPTADSPSFKTKKKEEDESPIPEEPSANKKKKKKSNKKKKKSQQPSVYSSPQPLASASASVAVASLQQNGLPQGALSPAQWKEEMAKLRCLPQLKSAIESMSGMSHQIEEERKEHERRMRRLKQATTARVLQRDTELDDLIAHKLIELEAEGQSVNDAFLRLQHSHHHN